MMIKVITMQYTLYVVVVCIVGLGFVKGRRRKDGNMDMEAGTAERSRRFDLTGCVCEEEIGKDKKFENRYLDDKGVTYARVSL